jgi:hypothetical protein
VLLDQRFWSDQVAEHAIYINSVLANDSQKRERLIMEIRLLFAFEVKALSGAQGPLKVPFHWSVAIERYRIFLSIAWSWRTYLGFVLFSAQSAARLERFGEREGNPSHDRALFLGTHLIPLVSFCL